MACAGSLFSQESNPYSRFGLGYQPQDAPTSTQSMGFISAGYSSASHINHANPASYADLGLTTFEVGVNANAVSIRTRDSIYNGVNGTVSHLAFGIPLIRGSWGMSFGLLPYSFVNYSLANTTVDTSQVYSGKGSLYQAYLGMGYKIKDFSFGVNAGYVFGSIDYSLGYVFPDSIQAYNIQDLSTTRVYGFIYNLGVQYRHRIMKKTTQNTLKSDVFFTFGADGTTNVKLNSRSSSMWDRYTGTSPEIVIDTPLNFADKVFKVSIPYNFTLGFTVGNENWWLVGADFKYTGWSQFSNSYEGAPSTLGSNWSYGNSWRATAGVGVVPDFDSHKFFSRIQYKVGGYYELNELEYHPTIGGAGTHLSDYGATLGFSIPILFSGLYREAAHFHFSTDIGTFTPGVKSLITDTYYRFNFGFTLNNMWFIKRKFD
jgi:hypothetical protein